MIMLLNLPPRNTPRVNVMQHTVGVLAQGVHTIPKPGVVDLGYRNVVSR